MRIRGLLLGVLLGWTAAGAAAQGVDQVLTEGFDAVTPPALPTGWAATNAAWETSASSPSPGSGLNNVFNRGSSAGDLMLPVVDLSGAITAELTYAARRTSSYDVANLRISASTDGGATFPVEVAAAGTALPTASSTYENVVIALPAAVLDQPSVILRFEASGASSASANARIDDVGITAMRLVIVAPPRLSFLAMPGGTDAATVTLTNADTAPLQVNPPIVGGTAYSIAPAGAVSLAPGDSQQYTVTWSPLVKGIDNRTLLLVHEHGTASVALEGRTAGGIFGFGADSSRTVPGDSVHQVPMRLEFDDPAGLQGLQFSVSWDDSTARLLDVAAGPDVADSSAWTLSFNADTARATVVLLGAGTNALSSGSRDSLLSLSFALPDSVGSTHRIALRLADVVGALALAGGDDADLVARPDSHVVIMESGEANFSVSPTVLSLGTVTVGDTATAAVVVSNPAASIPLVVHPITSDNALFAVVPDSLVIPPDSAVTLTVSFAPVDSVFGAQTARLVFAHNGLTATDTVSVDATGEGGRGDAARDGVVDVVDLVQALDFVLLRATPDSLQLRSADLFPFPAGDGGVDVRDLTVLSHAIVNGVWPDSTALPVIPSASGGSNALIAEGGESGAPTIPLEGTWTLALTTEVPVRALQAVLAADRVEAVRAVADTDPAAVVTLFTRTESEVRVLRYRTDGRLIEAGTYELLEIEPRDDGGFVQPLYVIGVDEDLKRVPVTVAGSDDEGAEGEVPGDALGLGVPYPNPVRFSGEERLRLPLVGRPSDGRSRAAVFNILGQRVRRLSVPTGGARELEWDGRDQRGGLVSPGIYFIRLEGVRGPVRAAVVVR